MIVMQAAPGITPALLERIVASRPDLTKADVKEVRLLHVGKWHLGLSARTLLTCHPA